MMKKILINTLLIIVIFTSCEDFLSEVPKSQISPENYYQTAEHAEAAVIGVYNGLQRSGVYGGTFLQWITTDVTRTRRGFTGGGLGTYSFSGNNSDISASWANHYKGINEANAAVNYIPDIEMDEDRKNTLIAEVLFLRSLFYFNLVRFFGDVPLLITETSSLNNLQVPREPASQIYEQIIGDLLIAIPNLNSQDETQYGRATSGAAKTLLAKIYLTRASMDVRDDKGDGIADYTKAAQYAQEVITEHTEYQLNSYFPDAFIREEKNNNKEIIFGVLSKSGGVGEGNMLGMYYGLWGAPALGGSWITATSTQHLRSLYEPTDLVRREWTAPHVKIQTATKLIQTYTVNTHGWTYVSMGKYRRFPVRDPNFVYNDWDLTWPVFRLSEVYLIYAEALNEINQGPTEDVFNALNVLRQRARIVNTGDINYDIYPRVLTYDESILPDISSTEYPDYASMKKYIEDERARELAGEGKRWFDLVRWGKLVTNIKLLQTYIPEGRIRPEWAWDDVANNVDKHHNLMPIPISELQANSNLTQNPGYN